MSSPRRNKRWRKIDACYRRAECVISTNARRFSLIAPSSISSIFIVSRVFILCSWFDDRMRVQMILVSFEEVDSDIQDFCPNRAERKMHLLFFCRDFETRWGHKISMVRRKQLLHFEDPVSFHVGIPQNEGYASCVAIPKFLITNTLFGGELICSTNELLVRLSQ